MKKPTLQKLNENNNPLEFGGECLSDDGQGNELKDGTTMLMNLDWNNTHNQQYRARR